MFNLVVHSALLILAAFIIGAIFGCLLRYVLSPAPSRSGTGRPSPVAASVPAAPAAAPKSAPEPAPEMAPVAASVAASVAPVAPSAAVGDEAAASAALAALPADASNEDKANAVGSRPVGIAAARGGKKDNLQRIKGIGKVNEAKLNELGTWHFDQIAGWSVSEARWVGTFLSFPGRIEREDWIAQAAVLAAGGETEFAKRVDKGDVSTSSAKK